MPPYKLSHGALCDRFIGYLNFSGNYNDSTEPKHSTISGRDCPAFAAQITDAGASTGKRTQDNELQERKRKRDEPDEVPRSHNIQCSGGGTSISHIPVVVPHLMPTIDPQVADQELVLDSEDHHDNSSNATAPAESLISSQQTAIQSSSTPSRVPRKRHSTPTQPSANLPTEQSPSTYDLRSKQRRLNLIYKQEQSKLLERIEEAASKSNGVKVHKGINPAVLREKMSWLAEHEIWSIFKEG